MNAPSPLRYVAIFDYNLIFCFFQVIKSLYVLGERAHARAFKKFACEDLVNNIKVAVVKNLHGHHILTFSLQVPVTTLKIWRECIPDEDSEGEEEAVHEGIREEINEEVKEEEVKEEVKEEEVKEEVKEEIKVEVMKEIEEEIKEREVSEVAETEELKLEREKEEENLAAKAREDMFIAKGTVIL